MFPDNIEAAARRVIEGALRAGLTISTVESCTGGLVGGALTAIPGSSTVYDRGFITYSNAAKTALVGVPTDLIEAHGAVSEPVARAMASGARRAAGVDLAVSVTGIAGPGGGSEDKPVGLVHFALAGPGGVIHREERFGGRSRDRVRLASVEVALALLQDALDQAT